MKKNKEALKTSKENWLDRLNEEDLALYNKVTFKIQKKYDKYEQPTYKETKAKINKARRQGKLYETSDRNSAFKYVYDMRYTVDLIAKYDGRRGNTKNSDELRICVVDIYLYIRETGECVHLMDHEWFNTDLCYLEVMKFALQYGELKGGIVHIPYMKGLKYAIAYRKNLPIEETKYQLVTATKQKRVDYVYEQLKRGGRRVNLNYLRRHLNEF